MVSGTLGIQSTGSSDYDVIIIGAGPGGLTLANMLGLLGVKTLVLEQLELLIDYPRGVGIDDESLRTIQALGLIDESLQHITPNHWARFLTRSGKVLASIEPRMRPFGWSRRNAFHQPLVDAVLFRGLERFANVELKFGATVTEVGQDEDSVNVLVSDTNSIHGRYKARYLVGCDGGKSLVRKAMQVEFDGITAPDPFLVVDVENDPIGTPNLEFICDSRFPYVSIALPHGVRRFEFRVDASEIVNENDVTDNVMKEKFALINSNLVDLQIIRRRVYYHNARIASQFRQDRFLLVGDAAHLMPVWQGQGYNSALRDANNLFWKLAMVINGRASQELLDTYDQERRKNVRAMIDVSVLMGKLFSPDGKVRCALRDILFKALSFWPPAHRYISTMRWKPIPKIESGVIVEPTVDLESDPVGEIFFQPNVMDLNGDVRKLDDIVGLRFALVVWGSDPILHLNESAMGLLSNIEAATVVIVPVEQRHYVAKLSGECVYVLDHTGEVKEWFDQRKSSVVIVRPDRFIVAMCQPHKCNDTLDKLGRVLSIPV